MKNSLNNCPNLFPSYQNMKIEKEFDFFKGKKLKVS